MTALRYLVGRRMAYYFAVNHPRRFVAVFSPKCGCSTIKRWLSGSIEKGHPRYLPIMLRPRLDALDLDYPHFFFVRDPLRRLVSFYLDWVATPRVGDPWSHADSRKEVSLIDRTFRETVEALETLRAQGLEPQHHLESQTRDVFGLTFDEIIPVDHLDRKLPELSERFGMKPWEPLRERPSPYRDDARYFAADVRPAELRERGYPRAQYFFDEDLARRVQAIYAEDADLYRNLPGRRLLEPFDRNPIMVR